MMMMVTTTDAMMTMTAAMTVVFWKRPAESVQSRIRTILQMKITAHTGVIPQLAHRNWIMCQINCQKFSILLLFSKKILFLFKKYSILLSIMGLLKFLAATDHDISCVVFLNLHKLNFVQQMNHVRNRHKY